MLTQMLGLPYDQAADVADCAVGTIRSRVFRARQRLIASYGLEDTNDQMEERIANR